MRKGNTLHIVDFRENERIWNDKALKPIAVFIGLSPEGTYIRCFTKHANGTDCQVLASNGFGRAVLDVAARAGFNIPIDIKERKVEAFSQWFCIVDFFESDLYIKPAIRDIRDETRSIESTVELAVIEAKRIARKCKDQHRKLLIISAMGEFSKPSDSLSPQGKPELRWLLWEALRKGVESDFKDDAIFIRYLDAHIFNRRPGTGGRKELWMLRISKILSEKKKEDEDNAKNV